MTFLCSSVQSDDSTAAPLNTADGSGRVPPGFFQARAPAPAEAEQPSNPAGLGNVKSQQVQRTGNMGRNGSQRHPGGGYGLAAEEDAAALSASSLGSGGSAAHDVGRGGNRFGNAEEVNPPSHTSGDPAGTGWGLGGQGGFSIAEDDNPTGPPPPALPRAPPPADAKLQGLQRQAAQTARWSGGVASSMSIAEEAVKNLPRVEQTAQSMRRGTATPQGNLTQAPAVLVDALAAGQRAETLSGEARMRESRVCQIFCVRCQVSCFHAAIRVHLSATARPTAGQTSYVIC